MGMGIYIHMYMGMGKELGGTVCGRRLLRKARLVR